MIAEMQVPKFKDFITEQDAERKDNPIRLRSLQNQILILENKKQVKHLKKNVPFLL